MANSSNSIWEINQNKEHVIIGAVYSILAIAVLPVYVPIIYALRYRGEFKDNVSYKLINIPNICDLLQSFNHILTGFFIIFPIFALKVDPFVRIMGYTANTLWTASYVIIAVLAITRLDVTFYHLKPNKWTFWQKEAIFPSSFQPINIHFQILLALGGFYIFVIWIIGCVTLNFQLVGVTWSYDTSAPFVDILSPLELYFCFPIMVLSFLSYILILSNIYKKKRQSQSSSSLRTEISILVQATVLTSYMAVLMALWHNAESWFEMTDITLSLLNGAWVVFSHLNFLAMYCGGSSIKDVTKVGASSMASSTLNNRRISTVTQ
ncbi:hypothetical protein CAEBREN_32700 [Caenorhabditis brenneri]|uniref:Uncharacterized protein n=1 Tax=Caenorhabditis brenneri TaxID=135651 RepID=G0PKF0_CAEBE|nr:hypothetical protein CAEBREN_32700 [Caenorhabditis brenneri]